MKKAYLIVLIAVAIALLVFLFPKNCGSWGTGGFTKQCDCFGIKAEGSPFPWRWHMMGGRDFSCYGIPTGKWSCSEHDFSAGITSQVPCEESAYATWKFQQMQNRLNASGIVA